jgi:hypothetical protein
MIQKQRVKWERIRAKGMWRFVLLYGVLWWGGIMIIVTSIYGFFFRRLRYTLDDLEVLIPAFLVSGLVVGLVNWHAREYRYDKDSGNAS